MKRDKLNRRVPEYRTTPAREASVKKLAEVAAARRIVKPIALRGFDNPRFKILTPNEMGRLHIDEEHYQRIKITDWVLDLETALKAGGQIPDPVTVAVRPDGRWYIVDGQQRFCAATMAGVPLPAMLWDVKHIDDECNAFNILNAHKRMKADYLVRSWRGEIGDLLRKAEEAQSSPLCGKINLTNNSGRPFSSAALVKAVGIAAGVNGKHSRETNQMLGVVDGQLKKPGARVRAEAYLDLIAAVFGGGTAGARVRTHWLTTLAMVAAERWEKDCIQPDKRSLTRLQAFRWATAIPTAEARYIPLMLDLLRKCWKAA